MPRVFSHSTSSLVSNSTLSPVTGLALARISLGCAQGALRPSSSARTPLLRAPLAAAAASVPPLRPLRCVSHCSLLSQGRRGQRGSVPSRLSPLCRCAGTGHLLNENVICKLNGNPARHRRSTRRRKAQALTGGTEVTEAPRPGLPGPPRRLRRTPAPPAGTRTWDEAAGPPRPHSTLTQRSTGSLQSAPQARERSGPRLPAAGHAGRGPQHPECSRHPLPTRTNGHAN